MSAAPEEQERNALNELVDRCLKASQCLDASDQPQTKRTMDAMLCFKRLPLTGLPPKVERRLTATLSKINHILEPYNLKSWDQFPNVAPADLSKIEALIRTIIRP